MTSRSFKMESSSLEESCVTSENKTTRTSVKSSEAREEFSSSTRSITGGIDSKNLLRGFDREIAANARDLNDSTTLNMLKSKSSSAAEVARASPLDLIDKQAAFLPSLDEMTFRESKRKNKMAAADSSAAAMLKNSKLDTDGIFGDLDREIAATRRDVRDMAASKLQSSSSSSSKSAMTSASSFESSSVSSSSKKSST